MTIEIRPAAVRNQISEKARMLNELQSAIVDARNAVNWFCSAGGEFSGSGYAAAQEHMIAYVDYLNTIEACINKVRDADDFVSNALGVFGGESVVSEQEWLDKQQEAKQGAADCWNNATQYQQDYLTYGYSEAYMGCVSSAWEWESRESYAGQRLSDIYSYCERTNGAHNSSDLGTLYDAVRAGSAAFAASCGYDAETHAWGVIDSSWYTDEVRVVASQDLALRSSCGNVQPVAISNPITDAISDWWAANGTDISNYLKVGFAVAGMLAGAVMIASGVGAPAGAAVLAYAAGGIGLTYGFLDLLDGLNGLDDGTEHNWRSGFSRSVATAFGADPDVVEAGVNIIGFAGNLANAGGLVRNGAALVNSGKALNAFNETASATTVVRKGFEASAITNGCGAAGVGEVALQSKMISNAFEFSDSVEGVASVSKAFMDGAFGDRREGGSYAGAAFVAAGYDS